MWEVSQRRSVLERLREVPDGRERRGRIYPQVMILAMLLAGALEGESSLLGMWKRGRKYWQGLREHVGVSCPEREPCLGTAWYVLSKVDGAALARALSDWAGQEVVSLDGKTLRGSKREGERALQVLVMAGERGRYILAQQAVTEGDEEAVAVALLSQAPVEGKVVSLEAGLMNRTVVKEVMKKGGITSAR